MKINEETKALEEKVMVNEVESLGEVTVKEEPKKSKKGILKNVGLCVGGALVGILGYSLLSRKSSDETSYYETDDYSVDGDENDSEE